MLTHAVLSVVEKRLSRKRVEALSTGSIGSRFDSGKMSVRKSSMTRDSASLKDEGEGLFAGAGVPPYDIAGTLREIRMS